MLKVDDSIKSLLGPGWEVDLVVGSDGLTLDLSISIKLSLEEATSISTAIEEQLRYAILATGVVKDEMHRVTRRLSLTE